MKLQRLHFLHSYLETLNVVRSGFEHTILRTLIRFSANRANQSAVWWNETYVQHWKRHNKHLLQGLYISEESER